MERPTYKIEVTKTNHPKSEYQTKYGNLTILQAAFYWSGLNIGNGYKARLVRCFYSHRRIVSRKA